jgi:hypothetical protein
MNQAQYSGGETIGMRSSSGLEPQFDIRVLTFLLEKTLLLRKEVAFPKCIRRILLVYLYWLAQRLLLL